MFCTSLDLLEILKSLLIWLPVSWSKIAFRNLNPPVFVNELGCRPHQIFDENFDVGKCNFYVRTVSLKFYEPTDKLWTLEKDTCFLSEPSLTSEVHKVMK